MKWQYKNNYLVKDSCKYLIQVFNTSFGVRAQVLDWHFFKCSGEISIKAAKAKVNKLSKGE
jgi:hypothetical protein